MTHLMSPKKFALAALLVAAWGTACAGLQAGTVTMEEGTYDSSATSAGYRFFYLSGAKSGSPACNTVVNRWVINNNWPAAKFQIAMLIASITSGKSVLVVGSGRCDVWGDTETAVDIRLNPNLETNTGPPSTSDITNSENSAKSHAWREKYLSSVAFKE